MCIDTPCCILILGECSEKPNVLGEGSGVIDMLRPFSDLRLVFQFAYSDRGMPPVD